MALRDLLVGRDPFVSMGAPLMGFLLGGVLWQSYRQLLEGYAVVPAMRGDWLLLGVLLFGPALLAVWNDGLVVCWAFDFGPMLAVYLAQLLPSGEMVPSDPYATLFGALALSAGVAILLGTGGFLLGVGVRETITEAHAWWIERSMG